MGFKRFKHTSCCLTLSLKHGGSADPRADPATVAHDPANQMASESLADIVTSLVRQVLCLQYASVLQGSQKAEGWGDGTVGDMLASNV